MEIKMQIILLQDVKALGKKGQVVEVSDGYARNFILPKKLGVEANGKNMNDLKLQKANAEKVAKEQLEAAKEQARKIEAMPAVTLTMKTGEGGRSFGSISTKEIAAAAEKAGLILDKKKMVLDVPIKSLGNYTVQVKLHKDVVAKLAVKVVEA